MVSSDGLEIERKYDVDEHVLLPPLHDLPGVGRVEKPVEHRLTAVYYDTADLALARARISLRRRTGGEDAGWHLKLPAGTDTRHEIHEPAGKDGDEIPERLLHLVQVHVRGRTLVPIARLRTRRITHRLHAVDESVLADLVDDKVRAEPLVDEAQEQRWREWEAELITADTSLLDDLDHLLTGAGAHPAPRTFKLALALGDRYPEELHAPQTNRGNRASAEDVIRGYLAAQAEALKIHDPDVRQQIPDGIHQMRVATRRMRASLRTYRKLFDKDTANDLRTELKWLAGLLGQARDAEVLRERLLDLVHREPGELVLGPVGQRLEETLATAFSKGQADVLQALNDARYFKILDDLDTFLTTQRATGEKRKAVRRTLAALVDNDVKRLRRRIKSLDSTTDRSTRDIALHEVRKKAKRLRYAAEAAEPVHGKTANRVASNAHRLQKILGDHQDSVVSRSLLRQVGAQSHLDSENGFTYGLLYAREQYNAEQSESRFIRALDKTRKMRLT